jgi:hypothetical protein
MTKVTKNPKTEEANQTDPIFAKSPSPTEGGALAVAAPASAIIRTAPGAALHAGGRPVTEVKLGQPTSAVGEPGQFYVRKTGEILGPELLVVPVKLQPTRTLWQSGGFQRGVGPECASADGEHAVLEFYSGDKPLYPGRRCVECPYYSESGWEPGPDGRACRAGYDCYAISLATYEIILYKLGGTAVYVANTLARPDVFGRRVVKLFSKKQVSQQGSWYQVFGQPLAEVNPEQAVVVNGVIRRLSPEIEPSAA